MGETVPRERWPETRLTLPRERKAPEHQADAPARKERALPRGRIEKAHGVDSEGGPVALAERFRDPPQRIVEHFMPRPDREDGSRPMGAFRTHGHDPVGSHPGARRVRFVAPPGGPLEEIPAARPRTDGSFPGASSLDNTFGLDCPASPAETELSPGEATRDGRPSPVPSPEIPGGSVFAPHEPGRVHHICPIPARGLERLDGACACLHLVAGGRNGEGFPFPMDRVRPHDGYA